MLTDIIDFLVDLSNTFGSALCYLQQRLRNYRQVVERAPCGSPAEYDDLCDTVPQLRGELAQCPVAHPVVLVDSVKTRGNRSTVTIALLDQRLNCLHVFSSLVTGKRLMLPGVPCYWNR